METKFQFAVLDDLPEIVEIYNQAIGLKIVTGHTKKFNVAERKKWFKKFDKNNNPIYTVKINNKVVAYSTLSAYRIGRKAMSKVVELSIYVKSDYKGKGIASIIIKEIIADCKRINKTTLIGFIMDNNIASINLVTKFGFQKWGHLPDIIDFGNRKCGHFIYGLHLT